MSRRRVPEEAKLSTLLSVRISPRMRYGLFLLSRRGRESISQATQAVLEAAMSGSATRLASFDISDLDLDALWNPLPWVRLQKLQAKHPDMVSSDERRALETVGELGSQMNKEVWKALQSHLRLEI